MDFCGTNCNNEIGKFKLLIDDILELRVAFNKHGVEGFYDSYLVATFL